MGSAKQIAYVKSLYSSCKTNEAVLIVDPAMADNGKLYVGFDMDFVANMRELCAQSDYLLPNLTEACLLIGEEYREDYDEAYIDNVLAKLATLTKGVIVMTGIGFEEGKTGVIVYKNGEKQYYAHQKISKGCHGTGDIYASAFVGGLMRGKTAFESAKIAADYTVLCIQATQTDPAHWYGARFETSLPELIKMLA